MPFSLSLSIYLSWFREATQLHLNTQGEAWYQCENRILTKPSHSPLHKCVWADQKPSLAFPFSQSQANVQIAAGFWIPEEAACQISHGVSQGKCILGLQKYVVHWAAGLTKGGSLSCVQNAHTHGNDNMHGILSLIFLSQKLVCTDTHTPAKGD